MLFSEIFMWMNIWSRSTIPIYLCRPENSTKISRALHILKLSRWSHPPPPFFGSSSCCSFLWACFITLWCCGSPILGTLVRDVIPGVLNRWPATVTAVNLGREYPPGQYFAERWSYFFWLETNPAPFATMVRTYLPARTLSKRRFRLRPYFAEITRRSCFWGSKVAERVSYFLCLKTIPATIYHHLLSLLASASLIACRRTSMPNGWFMAPLQQIALGL